MSPEDAVGAEDKDGDGKGEGMKRWVSNQGRTWRGALGIPVNDDVVKQRNVGPRYRRTDACTSYPRVPCARKFSDRRFQTKSEP